jgi:hypothetical protein
MLALEGGSRHQGTMAIKQERAVHGLPQLRLSLSLVVFDDCEWVCKCLGCFGFAKSKHTMALDHCAKDKY